MVDDECVHGPFVGSSAWSRLAVTEGGRACGEQAPYKEKYEGTSKGFASPPEVQKVHGTIGGKVRPDGERFSPGRQAIQETYHDIDWGGSFDLPTKVKNLDERRN